MEWNSRNQGFEDYESKRRQFQSFIQLDDDDTRYGLLGIIDRNSEENVITFDSGGGQNLKQLLNSDEMVKNRLIFGFNFVILNYDKKDENAFKDLGELPFTANKTINGTEFSYYSRRSLQNENMHIISSGASDMVDESLRPVMNKHNITVNSWEKRELNRQKNGKALTPIPITDYKSVDRLFIGKIREGEKLVSPTYKYVISQYPEVKELILLNRVLGSSVEDSDFEGMSQNVMQENLLRSTKYIVGQLNSWLWNMFGKSDGINVPWIYYGFKLSPFFLHTEDFKSLNSINILIHGEEKIWIIIPPRYIKRLEEKFLEALREENVKVPQCSLKHKHMVVTTEILTKWKIGFYLVRQSKSCMIITSWNGFHQGYNSGNNCAIALNTVLDDWYMFQHLQINRCFCKTGEYSYGVPKESNKTKQSRSTKQKDISNNNNPTKNNCANLDNTQSNLNLWNEDLMYLCHKYKYFKIPSIALCDETVSKELYYMIKLRHDIENKTLESVQTQTNIVGTNDLNLIPINTIPFTSTQHIQSSLQLASDEGHSSWNKGPIVDSIIANHQTNILSDKYELTIDSHKSVIIYDESQLHTGLEETEPNQTSANNGPPSDFSFEGTDSATSDFKASISNQQNSIFTFSLQKQISDYIQKEVATAINKELQQQGLSTAAKKMKLVHTATNSKSSIYSTSINFDMPSHEEVNKADNSSGFCCTCGKQYTTRFFLKEHIKSESHKSDPVKPFICDKCGSSYATDTKLKRHLKKHI